MARSQRGSSTPPWKDFERQVGLAYSSLGYSVRADVNMSGQQADLICEKHVAGLGRAKILIECKYTSGNAGLPKDLVAQFITRFDALRQANSLTAGAIISNRRFTQYAQALAAQHPCISVRTLDDIHLEVLGIQPYLQSSIDAYSDDGLFSDYVELTALPRGASPTGSEASLATHFTKWLNEAGSNHFCLVADFGAGKTTFLKRMHATLGAAFLKGTSVRMPLFLPLREYGASTDAIEIVETFFSRHVGQRLSYKVFERFNADGRFVLLCDGFDEMGSVSDRAIRRRNYLKLNQLMAPRAKVVVSCRPAYFLTETEMAGLIGYRNQQLHFAPVVSKPSQADRDFGRLGERLYVDATLAERSRAAGSSGRRRAQVFELQLFDEAQVRVYLRHHRASIVALSKGELDDESLLDRMRAIYDLDDLAKRPILLKLIASTLPRFRRSTTGVFHVSIDDETHEFRSITPSVLYYTYTEGELSREYEKGDIRWQIDRVNRRRLLAALAHSLLSSGRPTITSSGLQSVLSTELRGETLNFEQVLTDIRTSSFLTRDSQDVIRFSHKSFMEFYAASYLYARLSSTATDWPKSLDESALPEEVLYFLGDYVAAFAPATLEAVRQAVVLGLPQGSGLTNALNILNFGQAPALEVEANAPNGGALIYQKLQIGKLTVHASKLPKLDVRRSRLDALRVVRSVVKQISVGRESAVALFCEESKCGNVDFDSAAAAVTLHGTTCHLGFSNAQISRLMIGPNSAVAFRRWENSSIADLEGQEAIIANGGQDIPSDAIGKVVFHQCTFLNMAFDEQILARAEFWSCVFVGCTVPSVEAARRLPEICDGYVIPSNELECYLPMSPGLIALGSSSLEKLRNAHESQVLSGKAREALGRRPLGELLALAYPPLESRDVRDMKVQAVRQEVSNRERLIRKLMGDSATL